MAKNLTWKHEWANRSYAHYLSLKIPKALIALPLFVFLVPAMAAVGVVYLVCMFAKSCVEVFVEYIDALTDFWRKNWFTGFSRKYYNGLQWRRKLTPMKPVDISDDDEPDDMTAGPRAVVNINHNEEK